MHIRVEKKKVDVKGEPSEDSNLEVNEFPPLKLKLPFKEFTGSSEFAHKSETGGVGSGGWGKGEWECVCVSTLVQIL